MECVTKHIFRPFYSLNGYNNPGSLHIWYNPWGGYAGSPRWQLNQVAGYNDTHEYYNYGSTIIYQLTQTLCPSTHLDQFQPWKNKINWDWVAVDTAFEMGNANNSCAQADCESGAICIDEPGTQIYHCVPTPCEQMNCTGLGESCSYNADQVYFLLQKSFLYSSFSVRSVFRMNRYRFIIHVGTR